MLSGSRFKTWLKNLSFQTAVKYIAPYPKHILFVRQIMSYSHDLFIPIELASNFDGGATA